MPQHTDSHYEEELQRLQELILRMGGLAERQISRAIHSLVERDSAEAQQVIAGDADIDRLDIEIDELCLRLVALHQPAAGDLRFITTALKVTVDIERIADQAVNISKRAVILNDEPALKPYIDIPRMAESAERMVHQSLDAMVRRDTPLAREVLDSDAFVDKLAQQIFRELLFASSSPSWWRIPRRSRARRTSSSSPGISNVSPTTRRTSPRWSSSWSTAK
jgi:phosphate transport system protein